MELRRLLVAAAFAGSLASMAMGQGAKPRPGDTGGDIQSFSGEMEMTFGTVRLPDGTYRSVKGLRVPFRAERVYLKSGQNGNGRGRDPKVAVEVYRNVDLSSMFYTGAEFPMPSSLDDAALTGAGHGQPWSNVTVGYHAETTQNLTLRYIVYDTFVSGRGAGVSAFTDLIADFGGYFSFSQLGDWVITFDFSIMGITVQDGQCYFASQIRQPHPQGEGAFLPSVWTLFSGGGVTAGVSEDLFYYDNDPLPDGIYDETEADNFGGSAGSLANLVLAIEVSGSVSEVFPIGFGVLSGNLVGGTFTDLWWVDNNYVRVRQSLASESVWPVSLYVEGLAPSANLTSIRFNLNSKVNLTGQRLQVALLNYQTSQWDVIAELAVPTAEQALNWTVGTNPRRYVNQTTNRMRARIQWRPVAQESTVLLLGSINRATWTVATP